MLCENNRQTRIHSETHSQVAGSTAELIRNIIIMVMFISVGVLKCVIILHFAVARLYSASVHSYLCSDSGNKLLVAIFI